MMAEPAKNDESSEFVGGGLLGEANNSIGTSSPLEASEDENNKAAAKVSDAGDTDSDEDIGKARKKKQESSYTYWKRPGDKETAHLYKDNVPKKLDADDPQATAARAPLTRSLTKTSAWNYAGTWEERDVSESVKSHLESIFHGFCGEDSSAVAALKSSKVTYEGLSVSSCTASIAVVRKQPKLGFDLSYTVELSLDGDDSGEGLLSISLTDFCDDDSYFHCSFAGGRLTEARKSALMNMLGGFRIKLPALFVAHIEKLQG